MTDREKYLSCRNKKYMAEVSISSLPASEKKMAMIVSFLDYIRERKDVIVLLRICDQEYEEDVPQTVMLSESSEGIYMELEYSMTEWGWTHPLLLANCHLTKEEAVSVLYSIFYECTDDDPIVFNSFGNISSYVYPEEDE